MVLNKEANKTLLHSPLESYNHELIPDCQSTKFTVTCIYSAMLILFSLKALDNHLKNAADFLFLTPNRKHSVMTVSQVYFVHVIRGMTANQF